MKTQILDAAQAKLADAVTNGRIDQARADEMLQRLGDRLDEVLVRARASVPVE